jgi:hypothetical protein
MIVAGVGLGTRGRKQHRCDQQGRAERKARKVPQVSHLFYMYHKLRPKRTPPLDKGSHSGKVKGDGGDKHPGVGHHQLLEGGTARNLICCCLKVGYLTTALL